jgi:hypothetical protein
MDLQLPLQSSEQWNDALPTGVECGKYTKVAAYSCVTSAPQANEQIMKDLFPDTDVLSLGDDVVDELLRQMELGGPDEFQGAADFPSWSSVPEPLPAPQTIIAPPSDLRECLALLPKDMQVEISDEVCVLGLTYTCGAGTFCRKARGGCCGNYHSSVCANLDATYCAPPGLCGPRSFPYTICTDAYTCARTLSRLAKDRQLSRRAPAVLTRQRGTP